MWIAVFAGSHERVKRFFYFLWSFQQKPRLLFTCFLKFWCQVKNIQSTLLCKFLHKLSKTLQKWKLKSQQQSLVCHIEIIRVVFWCKKVDWKIRLQHKKCEQCIVLWMIFPPHDERVVATTGFRSFSCSAPRLWNPLSHWHLKSHLKKHLYRVTFPSKTATILLSCFLSAYREFAMYSLSIHPPLFHPSTFKMVFPLWDCGEDAGRYPSGLWGRGRVASSPQGCIERKTVTFTPKDNSGMHVFGL